MNDTERVCMNCARHRQTDGYCGQTARYTHAFAQYRCFTPRVDEDEFPPIKDMLRPGMKRCKDCGRILPLEAFPRHPKSRDGHDGLCFDCKRKKGVASNIKKAARRVAPEREQLPSGLKRCTHCGQILPVSSFGRHYSTYDKLQPVCTPCRSNEQRLLWINKRKEMAANN